MHNYTIDINADVGEGIGNESQLLPYLSSCNIACGGHAGNKESMRNTIQLALKNEVKIGIHPSYPDKENFGRVSMQIAQADLIESLQSQISLFKSICDQEKAKVHHVKPHGALYNDIAKDSDLAHIFLKAISSYKKELKLYVPYASVIAEVAKKEGFTIIYEAFLDRNYHSDLSLVSRNDKFAMCENPSEVLAQLVQIVKNKRLKVLSGELVKIEAKTFCIHGDSNAAFEILAYLHIHVLNHQIRIK